jgi:hypothetical protein
MVQGGGGSVTSPPDGDLDGNGNSGTAPVFVNPGIGNFEQQPTSTGTINRGTSATVNGFGLGAFDLGGVSRCAGTAPDIGADELAGSACPVPPSITPPAPKKKCKKGRKLKKGKCVKKKRKKKR